MALKPREPRRKVMIQARMRLGASWSDACILNLSSRGMLVRGKGAPSRGAYLEIRRGHYVVVARVVWANADRFGVETQDIVPAEQLINHPDRASGTERPSGSDCADRRVATRPSSRRHEANRWRARAFEFGTVALAGAAAAFLLIGVISEVLDRPFVAVATALSRNATKLH